MSKFSKEIEIKFKVDENILNNLKNIRMTSYTELDEYVFTQHTLDNDIYLRFRHKKGKILLNLKNITLGEGKTKDCYEADEIDVKISQDQYKKLKEIFNVMFPIKWIVNKTRSEGVFDGCKICHDKVEGLGNFLEIEGPKEKILEICKKFNLDVEKRDKGRGYVKIGMKKAGLI